MTLGVADSHCIDHGTAPRPQSLHIASEMANYHPCIGKGSFCNATLHHMLLLPGRFVWEQYLVRGARISLPLNRSISAAFLESCSGSSLATAVGAATAGSATALLATEQPGQRSSKVSTHSLPVERTGAKFVVFTSRCGDPGHENMPVELSASSPQMCCNCSGWLTATNGCDDSSERTGPAERISQTKPGPTAYLQLLPNTLPTIYHNTLIHTASDIHECMPFDGRDVWDTETACRC